MSAGNTISYIMATAAARRAVISLIKSTARGKREKRPRQSLRASRIKAWFLIAQGRRPYRGEKKSTSFVILAQSGIMELGNYVGGGAKQKGFYTSAVLRLVLRPCLSQKQMRKISKDRQRGSGCKRRRQVMYENNRKQCTSVCRRKPAVCDERVRNMHVNNA